MAYKTTHSGGSRWFMALSLVAMAAALILVGMELAKSRALVTNTANAASTSVSDAPAPGFVNADEVAPDESAPAASQAGSSAPAGSAGTNPEAIRNQ